MRVLIADDHPLVRRGLRDLLLDHFPLAEIVEAGDAREALAAITEGTWQLALIDLSLPGRGGLDLLREIKHLRSEIPLLVVSAHTEDEFALRALKLGVVGYVSKQSAPDVLVGAVKKVLSGGHYVSAAVAEKLAMATAEGWLPNTHENLSLRELQVLQRIAAGKSVKQIAGQLALSVGRLA